MIGTIPIPPNEQERLNALLSYRVLDTEPDERLDNLTSLASQICNVPISLVSLLDGERQWFKSKVGLGAEETPRDISFCQFAIMDDGTFVVENALEDERFQNNPLVTGDPNIRFYAGHPLTDSNGFNLGTLCVIDRVPKKLDEGQITALKTLANEVVAAIEATKTTRELSNFKRFFDMSLDMHCIAGTDGYFKTMNPSFERVLGFTREEMMPKPFVDFVHPDDVESTIAEVGKLAEGALTLGFENRYKRKDGGWTNMHWNCQPDPETGELFAVAHDITELKKAIKELDDFAYVVSHDLKAPLRGIATLSTFLEEDLEGVLNEETKESFDLLKSRVKRMESLINGILEYSRVGRTNQEKTEVNLQKGLTELVQSMHIPKGFEVIVEQNMPNVTYNEIQLIQLFQNLVSNAIKYHDREVGKIEVGMNELPYAYEFFVKDDGPGIDPQYHDRIFGIFQTLQSRDELESTGIGLTICKKIVEENGGNMRIESSVGHGSSFIFTVPK